MTFAEWVDLTNLDVVDVAARFGVSGATIYRWCAGKRPSLARAVEIERVTGGRVPASIWTVRA